MTADRKPSIEPSLFFVKTYVEGVLQKPKLGHPWNRFREKIVLPEEFDSKLKDPNFASTVAAVGSYCLSHLEETLLPFNQIMTFSQFNSPESLINVEMEPSFCKTIYSERKVPENTLEHLIQINRLYGIYWGAQDLAREMLGTEAIVRTDAFGSCIEAILKYPIEPGSNLFSHLRRALPRYPDSHLEEIFYTTLAAFRTENTFFDFVERAKDYRGVQVVLGDKPKMTEFLSRKTFKDRPIHKAIDDWGAQVENHIPANLVVALVPLGRYEQRRMVASK